MKKIIQSLKDLAIKIATNDLVERAFHTAWQTALVVWAMSGFDLSLVALGAAGGAALSAAKTIFLEAVRNIKAK